MLHKELHNLYLLSNIITKIKIKEEEMGGICRTYERDKFKHNF